jgi:hypothetical protein
VIESCKVAVEKRSLFLVRPAGCTLLLSQSST